MPPSTRRCVPHMGFLKPLPPSKGLSLQDALSSVRNWLPDAVAALGMSPPGLLPPVMTSPECPGVPPGGGAGCPLWLLSLAGTEVTTLTFISEAPLTSQNKVYTAHSRYFKDVSSWLVWLSG